MNSKDMCFKCQDCETVAGGVLAWDGEDVDISIDSQSDLALKAQDHHNHNRGHNRLDLYSSEAQALADVDLEHIDGYLGFLIVTSQGIITGCIEV